MLCLLLRFESYNQFVFEVQTVLVNEQIANAIYQRRRGNEGKIVNTITKRDLK